MNVSERLREARMAAGLSQGQVAKKLNMHRPTISEIEAGRRKISTKEIEKFSLLYGVSIDWLVSGQTEVADDSRFLLAARELSKLKDADLEKLLNTIRMLKRGEKPDD